jgi:hypothetical protein
MAEKKADLDLVQNCRHQEDKEEGELAEKKAACS